MNSGNVDILLNNGDGTFQGAAVYFAAQYGFLQASGAGAAVANFGGTFPGVLASSSNGTLTLFQWNGKGGFQSPQTSPSRLRWPALGATPERLRRPTSMGTELPDAAVVTNGGIAILLANAGASVRPPSLPAPFRLHLVSR